MRENKKGAGWGREHDNELQYKQGEGE